MFPTNVNYTETPKIAGVGAEQEAIKTDILSLSRLQQKIMDEVHQNEGMTVGEIAKRCFTTPNTMASSIRVLRNKGLLRSEKKGRQSLTYLNNPKIRAVMDLNCDRYQSHSKV